MTDYSIVRYLLSKQPIDDRSINRQVLAALEQALPRPGEPLRVLELGAGVGTMVSRLFDWGVLQSAEYTLVDRDQESLLAARRHLESWAEPRRSTAVGLHFERPHGARLDVRFVHADIGDYLDQCASERRHQLVVANAVLDLFDLQPTLPRVWRALAPGALFWFTINFDGETIFLPELPEDERVMHLYHASMGHDAAGTRGGHSQTGRRLLQAVPASGADLLAAGSSDWVVFPRAGAYGGDEAYFLHHIVEFVRSALEGSAGPAPFEGGAPLARADIARWVAARHAQIEHGELVYIAHQLDVFGRTPS